MAAPPTTPSAATKIPRKRAAEATNDDGLWADTNTGNGANGDGNGHKHARMDHYTDASLVAQDNAAPLPTNEPPAERKKVGGFRGKKAPDGYARAVTAPAGIDASLAASMTSLFNGTGNEYDEQRRVLVRLVGIRDGEQKVRDRRLPGPLPATLGRVHLTNKLYGHDYWVCEKSDGERAMLLVTSKGAWLIDRKFAFRAMPSWSSLSSSICTRGSLLLDGELVNGLESKDKNAPPAGERYMVFDAIAINDDDGALAQKPHSERRKAIEKALAPVQKGLSPPILVKKFVKPTDLGYLFSKITRDSGGHWIYNGGERGMNRNDGIVFTPEHENYLCKVKDVPLLKWKWPGMNTIDFKVISPFFNKKNPDQVELYAGAPGGRDIMVRAALMSQHDRDDIVRRTSAAQLSSAIVECAFDTSIGQWTVKGYRLDKTDANFITTVMATMENIAENVAREELIQTFPNPNAPSQQPPAASSSSHGHRPSSSAHGHHHAPHGTPVSSPAAATHR